MPSLKIFQQQVEKIYRINNNFKQFNLSTLEELGNNNLGAMAAKNLLIIKNLIIIKLIYLFILFHKNLQLLSDATLNVLMTSLRLIPE